WSAVIATLKPIAKPCSAEPEKEKLFVFTKSAVITTPPAFSPFTQKYSVLVAATKEIRQSELRFAGLITLWLTVCPLASGVNCFVVALYFNFRVPLLITSPE